MSNEQEDFGSLFNNQGELGIMDDFAEFGFQTTTTPTNWAAAGNYMYPGESNCRHDKVIGKLDRSGYNCKKYIYKTDVFSS